MLEEIVRSRAAQRRRWLRNRSMRAAAVRREPYERAGNLGITRVRTLKTNFTENAAIIAATGRAAHVPRDSAPLTGW